MKKVIFIIVSIIIILIISGIVSYIYVSNNYEKQMRELVINEINLKDVEDGTYFGSYSIFPIIVELNVEIKNHNIVNINIVKHQTGQGQSAESIIDSVIAEQSLKVDTISKATGSSKVILKAIENAVVAK